MRRRWEAAGCWGRRSSELPVARKAIARVADAPPRSGVFIFDGYRDKARTEAGREKVRVLRPRVGPIDRRCLAGIVADIEADVDVGVLRAVVIAPLHIGPELI